MRKKSLIKRIINFFKNNDDEVNIDFFKDEENEVNRRNFLKSAIMDALETAGLFWENNSYNYNSFEIDKGIKAFDEINFQTKDMSIELKKEISRQIGIRINQAINLIKEKYPAKDYDWFCFPEDIVIENHTDPYIYMMQEPEDVEISTYHIYFLIRVLKRKPTVLYSNDNNGKSFKKVEENNNENK